MSEHTYDVGASRRRWFQPTHADKADEMGAHHAAVVAELGE
jgi:hypothetical protein